jgi:hypothetical protein
MTPDKQTFSLSDEQWGRITKCLKLRNDARTDLEFSIHIYREQQLLWDNAPSEVRKKLKQKSAAASKLLKLLEAVGERERIDLAEIGYSKARLHAAKAEIKAVAEACAEASRQVSDVRWTYWQDQLIGALDRILWEFSRQRVSRSKAVLDFLKTVCQIAHPKFGPGAVVLAVGRFEPPDRFQNQNISKPDTESRR